MLYNSKKCLAINYQNPWSSVLICVTYRSTLNLLVISCLRKNNKHVKYPNLLIIPSFFLPKAHWVCPHMFQLYVWVVNRSYPVHLWSVDSWTLSWVWAYMDPHLDLDFLSLFLSFQFFYTMQLRLEEIYPTYTAFEKIID